MDGIARRRIGLQCPQPFVSRARLQANGLASRIRAARNMNLSYALLLLPLLNSPTLADPAASEHSRKVKAVAVVQTGLSEHSDDYAVNLCRGFQPTATQVHRFLERARKVDSIVYTHKRYSPCYATGTVEFVDGVKGDWQIHSGRAALLHTSDGQSAILFCRTCRWADPFEGGYSVD